MPIQVLEEAKDSITSLAIRSHLIVTGSVDGHVRTYDVRQGEMRIDLFDRRSPLSSISGSLSAESDAGTEPVTSVTLSADAAVLLVSTLDSTVRAMDIESGQMLQSFTGHNNTSYRGKACFGVGEASVISGDEDGFVFSWDLESVSFVCCYWNWFHVADFRWNYRESKFPN